MSSRPASTPRKKPAASKAATPRHYAVIGAGMAGIACARTLMQAGHRVTVLDVQPEVGGRMASVDTPHGSFDAGAQFFTVRDARFQQALDTTPAALRPWSVNAIRTLDPTGKQVMATQPKMEAHMVAQPTMGSLLEAWAAPIAGSQGQLRLNTQVLAIERDTLNGQQWQLRTEDADGGQQVLAGLDGVVCATPAAQVEQLLADSGIAQPDGWQLGSVYMAPSWTLLLAYAHAVDPAITRMGPQWNAARTEHPRITWVARESSKPGRSKLERWTVQASPDWARKHENDEPERVAAKMLQAFADVTRIRATPSEIHILQWQFAKTINPLPAGSDGKPRSHLWDATSQLGACGDWCRGYRVEDAFVSGLEMALAILGRRS
ncbi:hypothetical protein GCM10027082_37330 [Comamonas humi]